METAAGSSRIISGSFRDPSGFLFRRLGSVYRQVNLCYKQDYDHLVNSGLYKNLVKEELLIPHDETDINYRMSDAAYKVIAPEVVPFISYPYEWCFSQLRDAALVTLEIQKRALEFGMSLKDCSAYNVQFCRGKPIFIDTLSFEKCVEHRPWVAYRQFCQHFLAPLAMMSYTDVRLNQLFRIYMDGIPLDLASKLLPFSTCLKFSLLSHIHLHAKSQIHFADKPVDTHDYRMGALSQLGLIDNLHSATRKLKWRAAGTQWCDYYRDTNYSDQGFEHKKSIVREFLRKANPKTVWDLGGNTGLFSRIASDEGILTISFDMDPAAVENNYAESVRRREKNILPLLLDLTNPSSAIGWENQERMSLEQRGPADAVLALALIHHLSISNNVPFRRIAQFLGGICNFLIIEFVPKTDSQVQRLLATREDIFIDYTQLDFERSFEKYFRIRGCVKIADSERSVYLMQKE
jgi:hypothetical protein